MSCVRFFSFSKSTVCNVRLCFEVNCLLLLDNVCLTFIISRLRNVKHEGFSVNHCSC